MAKKEKYRSLEKAEKAEAVEINDLEKPGEDKIKFLVWFSKALETCEAMKPHHMSAIQAFFKDIGLGNYEVPSAFEEGLIKFGYRR